MSNFLKYGLMAGLLSAIYSLAVHFSGSDLKFNTTVAMVVILIVPIIFMVMAVKADRSNQEGLISFGEALKTSFLTYFIFIIIAMVVGHLMISLYSEADWTKMVQLQKDIITSMGSTLGLDQIVLDEQLDAITVEGMKDQLGGISPLIMNIVTYSFFGLILSLIISAIMKKNPTP